MTLSEAITQAEGARTALFNAGSAATAAQTKYDSALAAKQQADTNEANAVKSFNDALDALISAATTAKVTRATS